MIKIEARYTYEYDTQAELDWILANLPEGTKPVVDKLTKHVTYTVTQQHSPD